MGGHDDPQPTDPELDQDEATRALLGRLRRGDRSALAELFDRHRGALRRMVELRMDRRLAGRVAPSDVVQEVYLDADLRLEHYLDRPDMPVAVWLRLVAGQRLVDVHRRHLGARGRDAGREVSIDRPGAGASGDSSLLAGQLVGHLTSPSQAAIKAEALARLEAVLEALDPVDREVLSLRHFEELSNHEAARALGIGAAAASKRYVRALGRLKQALESIPGFFEGVDHDHERP